VGQPFGDGLWVEGRTDFYADTGRYARIHADAVRLNELSEATIGCAFAVLTGLGIGFLEEVYDFLKATGRACARL